MEKKKLKLPAGIQTFEEIRKDGYVYVDKTKYLVELINTGKIYFLARPRRFGKSLTVSTFDALFSGKKELFNGLYAEEFLNRPDFEPSPIIWLDMSKVITNRGLDGVENTIAKQVKDIATHLDVSLSDSNYPGSLFDDLIVNTYKKYQQKVVILVDEYDSPYVEFVDNSKMAKDVRDVLRNYYVQIKANEKYIRFVFITGISKFARFGVFSVLNNTTDISLMPAYAEMCGYTEEEIHQYFPDYLDETAKEMKITTSELIEKMRYYYNGFTFDREIRAKLYNPFSTLSFFQEKEFFNYWIDTGRSKMIADYLKHRNLTVEQFRNFPISNDFAKSPGDVDTTSPEGFLYQCGYLTLREGVSGSPLSLDYPNTEVLNSMSKLLTQNVVTENAYNYFQSAMLAAIVTKDVEKFVDVVNRVLTCIPYDDFSGAAKQAIELSVKKISIQEWLYRSVLIAFLRGCGVVTFAEVHTIAGRSDLLLSHQGHTWVIELKVAFAGQNPEKKAEEALQQIIDRNYASPYPDAVCVGMAIDDTVRQITHSKII